MIRHLIALAAVVTCANAQASIGSWIEPNLGQADRAVSAIARDGRLTMLLEPQRARVLLPRSEMTEFGDEGRAIEKKGSLLLELVMLGADAEADTVMSGPRGTVSRYFRGNDPQAWVARVAHYDSVRFVDVYPGIDLVYRLRAGRIEYDFEIEAGADPSQVKLSLHGADDVSIDADGNLIARTDAGEFRQRAPEVFRVVEDVLQPVAGAFRLDGDTVGFQLDTGDGKDKLIIDPVIEFSGYLGGSLDDLGGDIDVNSRGNLIVGGTTASIDIPGAPCCFSLGGQDLYFAEIERSSGQLLWISFVGGSGFDWSDELALDSQDNIVAVGYTESTDFPAVNAFQSTLAGSESPDIPWDGLVLKLADDGLQILFSTYYGGVDWGLVTVQKLGVELFRGVAIDANDHIHVAGETGAPDFPVTTQFRGRSCMQGEDGPGPVLVSDTTLVEFAPDGTRLFATCIGGSERDAGRKVLQGPDGRFYVGGWGRSSDLPTSVDAFQTMPAVQYNYTPFVLKLNLARTDIEWGSYVGGSNRGYLRDIAVGSDGSVAASGMTLSDDFPVTANALQPVLNAGQGPMNDASDAYVFKLSNDGTALHYSTYFGGPDSDEATAVQLDDHGRIYFAGETHSRDLIVRTPVQPVPRPLYGAKVPVAPAGIVNDIVRIPTGTSLSAVVAAHNGVNQFTRETQEDIYITIDVDAAQTANSLDVVAGYFFPHPSFNRQDVVFINGFAPNTVYRYYEATDEYFYQSSFQDAGRDSRAATIVDVDGGVGLDDIVVANFGQQNELYVDAADPPIPIGSVDGNTVAVESGYFGGVGGNDLVFANQGQDVRLLLNSGGTAYGEETVILSLQSPNVSALAAGDIDGDSDTDLVIGNHPGPLQIIRFTDFQPGVVQELPGSTATTNALQLIYIDDDDDLDLLVGNDGVDQLYLNDGSGNFTLLDDFPAVAADTRGLGGDFGREPYVGGDDGLSRYQFSSPDLFVAVIDPASGSLEFSTYLDGGAADTMMRGLQLLDGGAILVHGATRGNVWPVAGAAQASSGGGQDAVFVEIDIDIDDDAVIDGSDNCLGVANPAQRDTDNDAYGNFCDPDLNNDGTVNFSDLQLFKQRFFGSDPDADLDGDGMVNFADLQIAKGFIFGPPGPSGLLLP